MVSVVHILPSLALGGAERVTIELARMQKDQGLDVSILSLGIHQDFLVETVRAAGIPLTVCGAAMGRLRRYRCILAAVRHHDVAHIHSPRGLRYLAPLIPFFGSRKIVYTRHGLDPLNSPSWRLLHILVRPFIDFITFVTESSHDVFTQNHHWPQHKLVVITNGVPVPDVVKGMPEKPIRLGSVGRMVGLKGQSILLDAISLLAQEYGDAAPRQFKLKFFGAGPLENDLRDQARGIGDGLVEFCGEVQDLEEIYDNLDVIVVASESEGLSMVIIEAMARGLPAIATDVGGNPTLVRHHKTGLLVPYGSADALAQAIRELLDDVEKIERYGTAAQTMIEREFSLERTHRAYLQIYQSGQ